MTINQVEKMLERINPLYKNRETNMGSAWLLFLALEQESHDAMALLNGFGITKKVLAEAIKDRRWHFGDYSRWLEQQEEKVFEVTYKVKVKNIQDISLPTIPHHELLITEVKG